MGSIERGEGCVGSLDDYGGSCFGLDGIGTGRWQIVVIAWIAFLLLLLGKIRSLAAAMNLDGFVVQAGTDTLSAKHVRFRCCLSHTIAFVTQAESLDLVRSLRN